MYEIEKGIPLPGARGDPSKTLSGLLRRMDVGDSFLTPNARPSTWAMQKAVPGAKFKTRKVEGGFRVWRVE